MTTFGESCIIGMLLGEFKGILLCIFAVEAYTASWIEIQYHIKFTSATPVEAYTASWIEILMLWSEIISVWSRLIQPRGLKSDEKQERESGGSRGLYSLIYRIPTSITNIL